MTPFTRQPRSEAASDAHVPDPKPPRSAHALARRHIVVIAVAILILVLMGLGYIAITDWLDHRLVTTD